MNRLDDLWRPYEPRAAAPWDLRRAVHLHRRAGFAATWVELKRDVDGKPQEAVARLLEGKSHTVGCPPDFPGTAAMLADAAVSSVLDRRLKAAWVYRMLFSPDPLAERLTLCWHNHFATSNLKVQNLRQMQQQNDTMREHARGPYGALLLAAVRSPAMLVWLDADKNSATLPNENLGRELLELFTVGIGNFSEADVQGAARALTGWRVTGEQFRFDDARHDAGEKTVLARTEKFSGEQLCAHLVAQPATARRVAWRIGRLLLADELLDAAALDSLAQGLVQNDLRIDWAVATVLRSQRFFASENLAARILGPAEYVVGAVRAFECFSPPPSTLLLADWMARMGQDLYYPPNVGGWSEGRSWLASGSIVARVNFASALVEGRLTHEGGSMALPALVERHRGAASLLQQVEWLGELLNGGLPRETIGTIAREADRKTDRNTSPLETAVLILLTRPEAYLG